MRTEWNPESPSLLPAIICYADILGFRDMTERALREGKEREFLLRIKRSLSAVYNNLREASIPWGEGPRIFDMKVFTDNIVVAYPLGDVSRNLGEPELGTLLMLFAQVQASLAADGFFLRGAITAGQHYQDDEIVYGEALLEAVDLDKSGGPPRLVIGSSVEPLISEHLSWYGGDQAPHHHHLLEDPHDGLMFVDYLGVAFEAFPDASFHYQFLEAHSDKVSKALQEYESDTRVRPKYAWLAAYHNYVCRAFADRFSGGLDESADPFEIAIEAEAQRALDLLVPCGDLPAEQPPRPLDAQRLQERLANDLDPLGV